MDPSSRWLSVVVAAPPAVGGPADLAALPACADVIELRLDLLPREHDVAAWISAAPRPVLATVRSVDEGGAFDGTPEEGAAWLRDAHRAGAAWVDCEAAVYRLLDALGDARVLSSHGWSGADLASEGLRKIAVPVADADALDRARAIEEGFVVPYGPLGATRGAFIRGRDAFLYGAAEVGAGVVSGQPALRHLLDELRAGEVDRDATLFGLVGTPPTWSPSPALHNAVFRAEGRNALYVPLGPSLEDALGLPVAGVSVTSPCKAAAFERAESRDDPAEAAGAVNTLVATGAGWAGLNTDVTGIAATLDDAPRQARAFVYGAGGYARAAVVALRQQGYDVRLGARDVGRGEAAAASLDIPFGGTRFRRQGRDVVFVNATPAGARGEDSPFLTDSLANLVVLDAPYAADGDLTAIVRRARADGAARVVGGRELLVAQAVGQAVAFGATSTPEALRTILELAIEPRTLWLLGLRGAGKTTVGRALARHGRPFVDLDAEIERIAGRPVAAIVKAEGWGPFRARERAALERVADRRGLVVATGGGVVEDDQNVARLSGHAGVRVWLDVDPAVSAARVATAPRPPLPGADDTLAEARSADLRRRARFQSLADVRVDADRPQAEVVEAVTAAWFSAVGLRR